MTGESPVGGGSVGGGSAAAGGEVTRIDVGLVDRPYPVWIGHGLTAALPGLLEAAVTAGGAPRPERALLVSQQPVADAGHLAPVVDALRSRGIEVTTHLVPDGETAKTPAVLVELWRTAAGIPLTRRDVVVAVGGGVVGDLAGFLAATYARGIGVVQVPTTLLAQVDAAIGGKTGINLPEGKNLVGAFQQPLAVVCDVAVLATLSERVHREGFGEVAKAGLISDPIVLELLEASPQVAGGTDVGRVVGPSLLRELVERSVAVKARVVAADERESGERAFLNLGHTFGHAVESLTGYTEVLHGEAVSIGTVAALRIGVAVGVTPPEVAARGEAVLTALGLPTRPPALDRGEVWRAMARDKKASAGAVRFVLLADLARPVLHTPPVEVVDRVLDELSPAGSG